MPTLDELRGSKPVRPFSTHTVTLVTGQHLLDEQKRLSNEFVDELANAAAAPVAEDDAEQAARIRKSGERAVSEKAEAIKTRMAELHRELAEHQGEVTLVGVLSDGEWLRWKAEHPAREDDLTDTRLTLGHCNATDLYDTLGLFVAKWDGEELGADDWATWLAERITFADKRDLVGEVVALYETRLDRAPKSPSGSSATPSGSDDSNSPAN